MKIQVESIPDDGLVVNADVSAPWAREAAALALGGEPEVLHLSVRVERLGDHVRVSGKADGAAVRPCDRCGEPVRLSVSGPMDLYYGPAALANEGSAELSADELDIGWFDGESLLLDDVVAEQFALWAPTRVRCKDPGVEQVGGPHPCALPAQASSAVEIRPSSPFAKLRLPE